MEYLQGYNMSIYKNAIDSILLGVEDYNLALEGDKRRYISSTRNIFAGILLLFKEKLSQLSPDGSDEILIKKRRVPVKDENGKVKFEAKGNNTIDLSEIQEFFSSLEIKTDWTRVNKINRFRNDIEHYYSKEDENSIKGMISDCFLVVRDFISRELELDPKEELGWEAWEQLIKINEVFEAEKEDCNNQLEELDWISDTVLEAVKEFHCEDCLSPLLTVKDEDTIICKSCEFESSKDVLIEAALNDKFEYSYHEAKYGMDPYIVDCPYCNNTTYLLSEGKCQYCGESAPTECVRCGMDIPWEEISDSSLCGYCHYVAEKAMKD